MTMRKATSKKYNLKKRGKTHKNKNLKKRTQKRVLKRKARSRTRKTKKGGQGGPVVLPRDWEGAPPVPIRKYNTKEVREKLGISPSLTRTGAIRRRENPFKPK